MINKALYACSATNAEFLNISTDVGTWKTWFFYKPGLRSRNLMRVSNYAESSNCSLILVIISMFRLSYTASKL